VSPRYRFADFELDTEERTLQTGGIAVPLQDLPSRLLITLVEHAPATVERETFAATLWPPGTHLDVDASLNTAVARVREALGDDSSQPRFVATVPRRGYRFVATVEKIEKIPESSLPTTTPSSEPSSTPSPRLFPIAALLAILLTILVVALALRGERAGNNLRDSTTPNPEVRAQLLVGQYQASRRSREGLERAIAAFQSAAALDPTSSRAYSGLASSYVLLGIYDYWRPREAFEPAETMARRALQLDPESAEAIGAQGLVLAVAHWDWPAARAALQRAVELAPESPEAWFRLGTLESLLGRHQEGLAASARALQFDPTHPVLLSGYAWQLFQAGRGEEAIAQAHHAIDLHPGYLDAWDNLKWIEIRLGHDLAALEAWVRAEDLDNGGGDGVRRAFALGGLAFVHRAAVRSQVSRWQTGRYQSPFDIALEYASLGDPDETISWLQRSFAERETDLVGLAVDPRFDLLRDDPRFDSLLKDIGLPLLPGLLPRRELSDGVSPE
jgi:DNA-binding winged helix-turn-helix (wHTH) protein/Flp pilus assembly protein TadD